MELEHNTSSGLNPDWALACAEASENDEKFQAFRNMDVFKLVVEGTPREAGYEIKRNAKKYKSYKFKDTFITSDKIGSPQKLIRLNLFRSKTISPTTLRYINNLNNMSHLFNNFLSIRNIIEIGGGYGGEAKIVNDYFECSGKALPNYIIYDLPSSHKLIARFLDTFGYAYKQGEKLGSFEPNFSLVISNAAFSEMNAELQEMYFNSVIKNASHGYFITNFESHSRSLGGWSTKDFLAKLKSAGKLDVQVLSSADYLTKFDEAAKSKLIVFGVDGVLPIAKTSWWVHSIRRVVRDLVLSNDKNH